MSVLTQSAWAQQNQGSATQTPQQPPTVEGTVSEIKTMGRVKVLVVANDQGETMEIPLTNRVPVDIKGTGDQGFVRVGAFIGGKGVLTNKALFLNEINVLLLGKGKKPPRGKIGKAPRQAGGDINTFQVMGTIQAMEPNPDYPDYTMLALDVPGRAPGINLEKNYTVKVMSNDLSLIEAGMPVVLDGRLFRGKFQVSRVTINHPEPFSSEEYLKPAEPKED
ncbi:hypothetical protein [Thalassoglobus polymorphus]|nr:hypothetical protein [Thalassoglobus polymorphus]